MAQEGNFRMFSGDSKTLIFTVGDENSSAVDITGTIIRWQLAADACSTAIITKSTTASEITTTGATIGEFRVVLNPSDSASLDGVYYHEGALEGSTGDTYTVIFGWGYFQKDNIL